MFSCGRNSDDKDNRVVTTKISKILKNEKKEANKLYSKAEKTKTLENVLSNALNFSKKININASLEEGNFEYMTMADAKRILDNSKELNSDFIEKIADTCKDFNVVNYFMTNLAEKILSGEIYVSFKYKPSKDLPDAFNKSVEKIYHKINNNKNCAAGRIYCQLGIKALSNNKYNYSINVFKKAIKITDDKNIDFQYYPFMAIAYNCLHDFDNEAKAQYGNFIYFYKNRKKYSASFLKLEFEQYLTALNNAEQFNKGIKLAKSLIDEGYLNKNNMIVEDLYAKNRQKTYRH